ncbi:MAG: HRDC domain-containing protein [Deltaproteobacteria bacterium]|nr:HRDC domain-containing protein [Deltaproteobacteria bacterium]
MDGTARHRPVHFVSDESRIGIVDSLHSHARLGLDLEADSFHRYFEKVCLIQLSSPDEDVLHDPLALGLPETLRRLLSDRNRTLVLHGADFDVLSLKRDFDVELGGLFDTMIAARLLGRAQLGLKALLESELGVHIDKGEQRSDWAERPLSATQIEYARRDTMYLLELADRLEAALREAGRLEWHAEDCETQRRRPFVQKPFDPAGFWKLASGRLEEKEARALRAAWRWRDSEARARDLPPFRVMNNEALSRIARVFAAEGAAGVRRLAGTKGLPRSRPKLELVAELISRDLDDPTPIPPRGRGARPERLSERAEKSRAELRAIRDAKAKLLGLEPSILLSSADLDELARNPPTDRESLAQRVGTWRARELWASN